MEEKTIALFAVNDKLRFKNKLTGNFYAVCLSDQDKNKSTVKLAEERNLQIEVSTHGECRDVYSICVVDAETNERIAVGVYYEDHDAAKAIKQILATGIAPVPKYYPMSALYFLKHTECEGQKLSAAAILHAAENV